ncbi:MAG: glycosyltransferase [Phycisphaerales bacterium]|nr:MAG: glycosyltransferase [Phycisphaerales bacterium]
MALVDAYFLTGMGYQTTGWLRALVSRGHRVRAFSSCYVSNIVRHMYEKPFPEGLTQVDGGQLLRLPARQLPRDMVRCPCLLKEVLDFAPDMTLAAYPGTLFARDLFRHREALPGLLFSTFAENRAQRLGTAPFRRALLDIAFLALKRRDYRQFIETSDVAILQTPDTFDFLLPRIARGRRLERLRRKCTLSALGFEALVFHVDPEARAAERERLGIRSTDVVALYACKITPIKRLDLWVSVMAGAMRRVPALRAMLIGLRDGDVESTRVLSWIEATGLKNRFICLPFASREQLPRLYNAADLGVWYMQPSVTIQEAMGTGIYMLLTDARTVSHLVLDPQTGRYFPAGDYRRLEQLIVDAVKEFVDGAAWSLPEARLRRARTNAKRFSYEALTEQLAAAVQDPSNAVDLLALPSENKARA